MAYFYFPKDENLRILTEEEVFDIEVGISNLKFEKLPWEFERDIDHLLFYEDKGMNLDNGIMGYTKFFEDRILLSPVVVSGLKWKCQNGIPNNENAMSTIVHELTHINQMKWLGGFAWLFLNIPGIDRLTIERWAKQNETATMSVLSAIYDRLR